MAEAKAPVAAPSFTSWADESATALKVRVLAGGGCAARGELSPQAGSISLLERVLPPSSQPPPAATQWDSRLVFRAQAGGAQATAPLPAGPLSLVHAALALPTPANSRGLEVRPPASCAAVARPLSAPHPRVPRDAASYVLLF